jgi:hypothetical protein
MAMSDQNARDALLVAKFKAAAALRLAERKALKKESLPPSGKTGDGVVTIRFAADAKPLSAFGGICKVLGESRIEIPEYKQHRD